MNSKLKALFQKGILGKDRCVLLFLLGVFLLLMQDPFSSFMGKNTGENEKKDVKTERERGDTILFGGAEEALAGNDSDGNTGGTDGSNDGVGGKTSDSYVTLLEGRLQDVLAKIDGVGSVKVFVSLADTGEVVVEKDAPYTRQNESETDAEGGMRNNTTMEDSEETVYTKDSEGNEEPFIAKEIVPTVSGVLVVCQGGGSETVETEIKEAIQVLFGLEMNRIKVVKMKIQ